MEKIILESLLFRYATKRFDPTKKLSDLQVETLLEALRLTPTSFGLHLMKVAVVQDPALRQKLVPFSDEQGQVVDASHLLVLCRDREVKKELVDAHFENISETRNISLENLEGFKSSVNSFLKDQNANQREIWLEKQLYIALGNLLTVCAMMRIDACPMEGFDPKKYDEILGLESKNLASVLVVPIGFRHADDHYAQNKKVRRPAEKFILRF